MTVITIREPLRQALGDKGSDSLVDVLNEILRDRRDDILQVVEEKFERRLIEENSKTRSELHKVNAETKNELLEKIGEVKTDGARRHADTIKWMFIFWVGQIAVLVALLTLLK